MEDTMRHTRTMILAGALILAGGLAAEGMDDGEGPGPGMGPGQHGMMGGGPGGPGMRGGGPEKMLEGLDLNQTQKDKLKELRKARRAKMRERQDAMEDAQEELRDLLKQVDRSKAFEDRLRAKHEEVAKLMHEAGKDRFESMLEIRSILTDAQLKKFVELHEKRMETREERRADRREGRRDGKGPRRRSPVSDDDDKDDKK